MIMNERLPIHKLLVKCFNLVRIVLLPLFQVVNWQFVSHHYLAFPAYLTIYFHIAWWNTIGPIAIIVNEMLSWKANEMAATCAHHAVGIMLANRLITDEFDH